MLLLSLITDYMLPNATILRVLDMNSKIKFDLRGSCSLEEPSIWLNLKGNWIHVRQSSNQC